MVALLTLSVVLPCAYEYAFMERTAKSVWEMTPAERLEEIIIVDDASDPPLERFAAADTYKVRFFRHDEPRGSSGRRRRRDAAAASRLLRLPQFSRNGVVSTADREAPTAQAPDYWVPFVSHVEKNYKRVVVPTITNLDVDTWTEFGRPPPGTEGMSKCYLTFDGEFKWTKDDTEFVPVASRVMSGGLLAMSRRWWKETGGYDDAMRGWGGENIDQSLRIWRCGGEIVSATQSYVAHMWRDAAKPATRSKYRVPPNAKATNIARAGKAHMGGWYGAKLLSFDLCGIQIFNPTSMLRPFVQFKASNKPWEPHNGVNATAIESRMATCNDGAPRRPEWYLRRFKYVYRDGGVLPAKTFQLRHEASGLCLGLAGRTWGSAAKPRDTVRLLAQGRLRRRRNTLVWWHRSNRNDEGECCAGLKVWNTDQCLDSAASRSDSLGTAVCDLSGPRSQRATVWDGPGLKVDVFGCVAVSATGEPYLETCGRNVTRFRRHYGAQTPEFKLLSREAKRVWIYGARTTRRAAPRGPGRAARHPAPRPRGRRRCGDGAADFHGSSLPTPRGLLTNESHAAPRVEAPPERARRDAGEDALDHAAAREERAVRERQGDDALEPRLDGAKPEAPPRDAAPRAVAATEHEVEERDGEGAARGDGLAAPGDEGVPNHGVAARRGAEASEDARRRSRRCARTRARRSPSQRYGDAVFVHYDWTSERGPVSRATVPADDDPCPAMMPQLAYNNQGDDPKQTRTTAKGPYVLALSEPTYAARPDYIEAVQKHGMVVDWRLKIVAWFDQLGDAFDMKPETIAMATNYLDRYLSRRSCGGVNLQLAATASIFLASKVEEQRRPTVGGPRRRHADRSRSDLAFLAFPPSMIAVAAVLCALRARRADPARTEAFSP
ncbi:N-acetylgalactosaminyltransferase 7 [Aureococcus anophagefferens]|nr:N-acetylgalactosaminyltransferase 7 [Aureococcus anophagefferens]